MKLKELPITLKEGNIVALWEDAKNVEYYIVTFSKENKTALISYSRASSWDFLDYFIQKDIDYHRIMIYDKIAQSILTGGNIIFDSEKDIKNGDIVHTFHQQFFCFKEWIDRKRNLARVYFGYSIHCPKDFNYKEVIIDGKASDDEIEKFYRNIEEQGYIIVDNQLEFKYPTNYEKCLKILNLKDSGRPTAFGYKSSAIEALQKLIVFRDAWCKIYGEDVSRDNTDVMVYRLIKIDDYLTDKFITLSHILSFPTRELAYKFQDTFIHIIRKAETLM